MLKTVVGMMLVAALSPHSVAAQPRAQAAAQAPAAEKPQPPAAKAAPEPPPLPLNIRIEIAITDQTGSGTSAKKVVSMIAADRQPTNVRSSASVPVRTAPPGPAGTVVVPSYTYKTVQINVDTRPSIIQKDPNKILVNFGLEYLPTTRLSAQEETEPGLTSWNERLSVILESGKPMVVSQAADPTSDRKITVEVTATILK
jgi:hypothetical protein